jgi:hypothetical protein
MENQLKINHANNNEIMFLENTMQYRSDRAGKGELEDKNNAISKYSIDQNIIGKLVDLKIFNQ